MGKIGNLAWWAFGGNDRLKSCRALYKFGAFRRWRQRGKACGDRGSEPGHLGIFGRALDLAAGDRTAIVHRSEEHTSELQSLMRISYAVLCLKKKTDSKQTI